MADATRRLGRGSTHCSICRGPDLRLGCYRIYFCSSGKKLVVRDTMRRHAGLRLRL